MKSLQGQSGFGFTFQGLGLRETDCSKEKVARPYKVPPPLKKPEPPALSPNLKPSATILDLQRLRPSLKCFGDPESSRPMIEGPMYDLRKSSSKQSQEISELRDGQTETLFFWVGP